MRSHRVGWKECRETAIPGLDNSDLLLRPEARGVQECISLSIYKRVILFLFYCAFARHRRYYFCHEYSAADHTRIYRPESQASSTERQQRTARALWSKLRRQERALNDIIEVIPVVKALVDSIRDGYSIPCLPEIQSATA